MHDRVDHFLRRLIPALSTTALRFLLIAVLFTAVLAHGLPAQAQITDDKVAALVEALRLAAPNTGIENDGLFSDWQVKHENIVRWSERCTGKVMTPAEFEADPQKARQILACVMGKRLREQFDISGDEFIAVRRAASWWMTGDPDQYDAESAGAYTQKVLDFYKDAL